MQEGIMSVNGQSLRRSVYMFFLLLIPFAAEAQERGDINAFGGYSEQFEGLSTMHGWNASVAGNVVKHLAVVADFSGYYNTRTYLGAEHKDRDYIILFGPRYVHTLGSRWTPFAHVLIGNYRNIQSTSGSSYDNGSISKNSLALDIGGGLDIQVSNRISIRAIQLDVARISRDASHDHYGRISFGAVFRLSGAGKD
jgi:hypothetical protein